MKNKHRVLIRICLFTLIFIILFSVANVFFQPVWLDWNNYYTTYGFYEEPDDTIETLFIGPSIFVNGISPMELYDEYGICSYNLATEQQPMLGSYYWLQEAYRHHDDTLDTVFLEVSALRSSTSEALYHKSLDTMKFSDIKFRAVYDYCDGNLGDTLAYLLPMVSYHDRWTELEATDYNKYSLDPDNGTKGYNYESKTYTGVVSYTSVKVKDISPDAGVGTVALRQDSLEYFDKLVEFCQEKGLKLVLAKTPTNNWTDQLHNTITKLADDYGLEFLDFNYSPYYEELDYTHAYDSADGNHLNYYGAVKLTNWIGEYLVSQCGATDVRSDDRYSFMDEQLREYTLRVRQSAELKSADSVAEYLEIASEENNTILIMAMDEAANNLVTEQKNRFGALGLKKLSTLEYRASYLGVIENGKVVYEDSKTENNVNKDPLSYTGVTSCGERYSIVSGGYKHGKTASCMINDKEQAKVKRGLNIVVYNNEIEDVIDTIVFDTFSTCYKDVYGLEEASIPLNAYLSGSYSTNSIGGRIKQYQEKVLATVDSQLQVNNSGSDSVFDFLGNYMKDKNKVIIIAAQDEASKAMSEGNRANFEDLGLEELSKLEYRDSYIAVIDGGTVSYEKRDHGKSPISYSYGVFDIVSGGFESGNTSSIKSDAEYSLTSRGLNIVVYDKTTGKVVDRANFDTFSKV